MPQYVSAIFIVKPIILKHVNYSLLSTAIVIYVIVVGPNSDRQINQSSVRGSQCSWMAAVESRLIGPTKPLSKPPSGLSFRTAGTELVGVNK